MPNINLPVKPTYQAVTRYAAHNVVQDIKRITGMDEKIPVYYANGNGEFIQPGSAVDGDNQPLFTGNEQLNIIVQEAYVEDSVINTPVRHKEENQGFTDIDLGVYLKPIYSYTDSTISVNYKAKTRQEAEAWRDMIKVCMGENRQSNMHELDFHYPIPKEAIVILVRIHALRETVAGYGQDLGTYLRKHFVKEATTLTTMGGKQPILVIREKQIGVQGYFEFTEPVEANKDSEGPSWTISFNYRFSYQKPVAMNFEYPQMIHNQMLPPELYSRQGAYALDTRPSRAGIYLTAAKAVDPRQNLIESTIGGARLPHWDEWLPVIVPSHTSSILTAMVAITPGDQRDVCNLNQMEWVWHPAFEAFFKREAPYVAIRGESIIHVGLYIDYLPMNDDAIAVDNQLSVTAAHPLDLRRRYHVRVSFVHDVRKLSKRAMNALVENGLTTLLIFQSLYPKLDMVDGQKHLLSDGSLRRSYIERFFIMLRDRLYKGSWDGPGQRDAGGRDIEVVRIAYTSIVAKREKETK